MRMFHRMLCWLYNYERDKGIKRVKPDITKATPEITRTKVTRAQFDSIVHLRLEGFAYPIIARHVNLSVRTCGNLFENRAAYDAVIKKRDEANGR